MAFKIDTRRIAKLYNERIDFMLRYEAFGRKCRFIYPSKRESCPNCILNASGQSSGKYKPGGPRPFNGTTCPVCRGQGVFDVPHVEEDTMIVLFDKNMFFEPAQVSQLPDNTMMVIGDRKRTWNKVVRCERMVPNLDVYGDGTTYMLYGEPFPIGLFNSDDKSGSKYFYAYFVRESGG